MNLIKLVFYDRPDGVIGLLRSKPRPTVHQTEIFVHGISSADHEIPFSFQLIEFAVFGKEQVRKDWFDVNGTAVPCLFTIGGNVIGAFFVVAVNAKESQRQVGQFLISRATA